MDERNLNNYNSKVKFLINSRFVYNCSILILKMPWFVTKLNV